MDIKTVQVRSEHEGFSFLTITLPTFGKDFEKSLDQGYVDRRLFSGFRWKAGLPLFLGGFLDRVFERGSGALLDEPCIDSILAIRQLSLMFGKILLPCSDARERKAMRDYVKCEQDVRQSDMSLAPIDLEDFRRIGSLLFASYLTEIDSDIYNGQAVPKHGPGSTADRLMGNQKYDLRTWTTRLEEIFPAGEFLLPSWSYYSELDGINILEPREEMPVKVISVPKTLKTPRIIAVEPSCMQYAQQAVRELMYDYVSGKRKRKLSRRELTFPDLKRMIGFEDQSPNQRMAKEGSSNGSLATLDLSEASDRVSNQLVREFLARWPYLSAAVDASRSRKADVPGHGVIRLAKFASMGSALCFPIEAMVFLTLVFLGIERGRESNAPLSREDVHHFSRLVRVYGDDIIVPVDYVDTVVQVLQTFGSVVNLSKSFWNGKFRESCGKEYFDGHDVSIVKVRNEFPQRRQDVTGVISIVELRNQLYFAGYWSTCKWLDNYIRKLLKHFPVVLPSSPVLGRHSFLGYETQWIDDNLHSPKVKGYVVAATLPHNSVDGVGALLKYHLKRGGLPSVASDHLTRSGRALTVNIKLRGASPF